MLERLHAAGRLAMSSDTTWTDVDDAIRAALAGHDVAIAALA